MAQETRDSDSRTRDSDPPPEDEATIITRSVLRIALALVGFVLLLFALGQALGVDLLGTFAAFTQTWTGQWLVVAIFALFLILIALRGWGKDRAGRR